MKQLQGSNFYQDVDSQELPPLESLLGRYSWVETGLESPCGPKLNEGMTLQLKDPGVQGELTILGRAGVITAVRRCSYIQGDIPNWQCDVAWNVFDEKKAQSFPTEAHIYVGIVLDDNNAPFLEVVFRDGKAVRHPYGYAKRQADEGEAVGLSDAEKERLNFLTTADYDAMMDNKEDEQRKLMDERLLKEKLEKEEQQKQEIERKKREKERRKEVAEREAAERMRQPKPQEPSQKSREVHDGMTNKQRKAAQKRKEYEAKRAARWEREDAERLVLMQELRDRRINESQQARKNLVEEQERLMKEESRFDLLRNLPSAASSSTTHTVPTLPPKREEGAPMGFRGVSNASVKQEEVLPTLDQRGIKRTHPDDPSNDSKKRIKLEY